MKSKGVTDPFGRESFAEQPGLISYVGPRPAGVPSRVYERGVTFINMAYGGLITGANAGVGGALRGIQFGPGGTPIPFNYGNYADYGAGSTLASNFTGGNKGLYPQDGWTLIVPTTRRVAFGHIDYEVTDKLNVFVEASYGRSGGYGNSPPVRDQGAAATILRDNAFLHSSIDQDGRVPRPVRTPVLRRRHRARAVGAAGRGLAPRRAPPVQAGAGPCARSAGNARRHPVPHPGRACRSVLRVRAPAACGFG